MTLLETMAREDTLMEAWTRLYAGKTDDIREHSMGIDKESLAEFKRDEKKKIQEISLQLSKGVYKLSDLLGFAEQKKSGKFRLISAPCVRYRIVHAAVLAIIQKFFPEIRNGSSYCLPRTELKSERINFIDAFRMISLQVKKGNTYIFESDIESFFDKVNKDLLLGKLISHLPDDSIDKLISGVIEFNIGNIQQFKNMQKKSLIKLPSPDLGLSQGSPLSPLFANIYLNEVDAVMIKKFQNRYIRYVDDFIVLCSSKEETKEAFDLASQLLEKEGLNLPSISKDSESKTRIDIDLKSGNEFIFLGIKVSKKGMYPKASTGELKNFIDKKCFTTKTIKIKLKNKKILPTNEAKEKEINTTIQSKFGTYGYFHTTDIIEELNKLIILKAKQSMLTIKEIKLKKRGMPIISIEEWKSYLK